MIKHIKRLFGIKPTEVKVEVAPVQEVVTVAVTPVVEQEVPVIIPETVVVETILETTPVKAKKPTVKKARAKKSVK